MTRPELGLIGHNGRIVGHSESGTGTAIYALATGFVDGGIYKYRKPSVGRRPASE
jgi:hypothetical protein